MKSIHATFRNGRVELAGQVNWPNGTEVEVIPVTPSVVWPAGYFEQTAGVLADERFERPPQGDPQDREAW